MIRARMNRRLTAVVVFMAAAGLTAGCNDRKPKPAAFTAAAPDAVTKAAGGDELSPPGGDPAKRIKPDQVLEVPFIFWGGDVATFHANGGLETTPDSLFGKQGLKLKLTPGDDF